MLADRGFWIGAFGSGLLWVLLPGCGHKWSPANRSPSASEVPAQGLLSSSDRLAYLQSFRSTDLAGNAIRLFPEGAQGLLLIFSRHDCPIANAYAPRIERLYQTYESRGIQCILVQTDKSAKFATLAAHARDYQWSLPVIHDQQHELVNWMEASVTPQAALVNRQGEIVYLGRIDDQYVDLGKKRREPSRHELNEAIEAFLAGQPIAHARTPAVGCIIERSP